MAALQMVARVAATSLRIHPVGMWALEEMKVGAFIMLGTLFGLIALVFALVLRFDPEARRRPTGQESDRV